MITPAFDVVDVIHPGIRIRELILSLSPGYVWHTGSTSSGVVLVIVTINTPWVMDWALMT
tara:strand:- start:268 stop:447 length:180 start_codon:yes stop_codon:yes gene_type:complete